MDGLTPNDLREIRKAYVIASDLEPAIERAKACGFECDELDQRCQLAKRTCQQIIENYGPAFPLTRE